MSAPESTHQLAHRVRGLSGRERELLALLPSGPTNRELAAQLGVTENTVKTQLRHLYAKLGVKNRVQASTFSTELMPVAAADGESGPQSYSE